ncbi:hypothetical protein ZYGR_0AD04290 [Zygosaccharomyces rouxii]|uniref:ZYRO0G16060p n=2 Tax=Zygosaccharomyces rouxii TaxID=4956 RepID=C5E0W1_ZYGRC|nr:uncharacterized protein ZYRO0G16060g [Zygosaccharomyces rouxii]KAH9202737.1 dipeptidyl peptidase IV N-terminal region-domain-containing protein [Zygosaccharomyces rouxii]GAV51246.1 hypothetical protein ZYGR_0AD04290 [Zygosaccharomyces rouxii]CAR29745.1 ZYRO0G16060p [Zygosaccharomyces rouxii]
MEDIEKSNHYLIESSARKNRNGKGRIRTALLRYALLLVFVVLPVTTFGLGFHINYKASNPDVYRLPKSQFTKDGKIKVSFDNLRNGTFVPELKALQWIHTTGSTEDDKGLFLTTENDNYEVRSVFDEDYSKILWEGKSFQYKGANHSVDSLVASPNLEQLLIRTSTVHNWRHSSFGSYFVYNNVTGIDRIGDNLALAEWSPNSVDIAYVKDNDLYLYSTEESKTVSRITHDGSTQVFNGKPDWVYEEEIMETDRTLWWSPQGDYLAFFKINETFVNEFVIPYYVQNPEDVYSELRSIKYPKSGTPNPVADVVIYDAKKDKTSPIGLEGSPELLTEAKWVGDDQLLVKSSDRSSDVLKVYLVNAVTQNSKIVREDSSNGGWWEITHNTLHIPRDDSNGRNSDGYLDVLPIDGFNHLVYFDSVGSSSPIALTRGEWEIEDGPFAFDHETNDVYFIATKESSTQRHLYSVNLKQPEEIVEITDTSENAVYTASFSSGSRFVLISYRGPSIPFQKIVDLKSNQPDADKKGNIRGKTLFYLTKNEKLSDELCKYAIPRKQFKELTLPNGVIVNALEILPNGFRANRKNYYPVFFYAYGGPNSQQVLQTYSVSFLEVFASQLNAIIVIVDGRGTGFKGKEFRSVVRDKLGDYEAQDQIAAAALYSSKHYVDANKISLFGWSYGGYLTLKTLEKDAGVHFKYGISVAPVTDWGFYDSVYTERYMHTPQQNQNGYEQSSVHNVTAIAQAKRFLLMHGTGDDNVHFQNSLKVLDLLNLNSVENYDVHVFPDSDHGIRYHNANKIVWDKILNWTKNVYLN